MKLIELLEIVNESTSVYLYDSNDLHLGTYDGRDAIDKKYNDCVVNSVRSASYNVLQVFI